MDERFLFCIFFNKFIKHFIFCFLFLVFTVNVVIFQ